MTTITTLQIQTISITASVCVSLLFFIIALLSYLIKKRQPWAQALFNVMDRIETDGMREVRRNVVYAFPREADGDWEIPNYDNKKMEASIDRWGAEMDMLSLLFFSKQFDQVAFLEIYGDVVLRSAFKLAPYANKKRLERGEQFWLPFQKLTLSLLKLWSKRSKKGLYPERIGIPGSSENITPQELGRDEHIIRFLQANSLKLKL